MYPGIFFLSRFFVDSSVVGPELVEVDDVRMIDVRQHLEHVLQLVLLKKQYYGIVIILIIDLLCNRK